MEKMIYLPTQRTTGSPGVNTPKAMVDVAVNEEILIKGFKVVNGKNGLFVGLPSQPGKNGKWYNSVLLLKPELKQELEDCVLAAYEGA